MPQLKLDAAILPIDSKFPMENYQKMTKSHRKAEKEMFEKNLSEILRSILMHFKNIFYLARVQMDFALMYIPSESVYYEIVIKSMFWITPENQEFIWFRHLLFTHIYKRYYYHLRGKN